MDLQEQQMLTVFYNGYPAPDWAKLKDYVAARSPNIIKGVGAVKETAVTRNDVKRCPSSSRFYSKYQKFWRQHMHSSL